MFRRPALLLLLLDGDVAVADRGPSRSEGEFGIGSFGRLRSGRGGGLSTIVGDSLAAPSADIKLNFLAGIGILNAFNPFLSVPEDPSPSRFEMVSPGSDLVATTGFSSLWEVDGIGGAFINPNDFESTGGSLWFVDWFETAVLYEDPDDDTNEETDAFAVGTAGAEARVTLLGL